MSEVITSLDHLPLASQLIVRQLGRQDYVSVWRAMQKLTDTRQAEKTDEVWLVEHEPVFTQGQAGKPEHILGAGDIPVVQVDRGGQVTYHGPGQQVAYFLLDLRRKKLGVRQLVSAIEDSVVDLLSNYEIESSPRADAPGVYVEDKKICSLGLRIRRGCSFHGLALNVNMDLTPFARINPCGYAGMQITQIKDFQPNISLSLVAKDLIAAIMHRLNYAQSYWETNNSLDFA